MLRYVETTVIDRRTGKPKTVKVPAPAASDVRDQSQHDDMHAPVKEAPHSGRHAHRAERAKAATGKVESAHADSVQHPRKGWTVAGKGGKDDLYRIVKIDSVERPATEPMKYARKRKGVGGTVIGGVTAGSNLPGAKAEDAHATGSSSLHRESGSLIAKVELKLKAGSTVGYGDLRLECQEMALRIRKSNPLAAMKLTELHDALKLRQYDASRYC